jgi:hypothetical protein
MEITYPPIPIKAFYLYIGKFVPNVFVKVVGFLALRRCAMIWTFVSDAERSSDQVCQANNEMIAIVALFLILKLRLRVDFQDLADWQQDC